MLTRLFTAAIALILPSLPAQAQDHDCVVREFSLARNVINLEPQEIITGTYPRGTERAYAFVRLDCSVVRPGETFWFHWVVNDREVGKSKARVDVSRNWRIWSQSRIFPGEWLIQLKDSDGRLQAERRFVVAKPADGDTD
ncbi:DUF2914 domain-containing protein [uncultured Ferrovibrio sp.]|jgi:hypothetical protein|uniref:DUF2914 domain-containing protein n=1 Tax=uncultured Ferrovibrio sp. TaxID=1576913 RepID=UPI0026121411|nr:DUF2914 domain-containing protein [uncultured Ferrovibrio sp.]